MTTRRDFLRRTSVGAAAVGVLGVPAFGAAQGAPTRAPVKLTFWTWENPQQRPWLKKRIDQYTQQYPNVSVEFQYFAFSDLGKKVSIGYATGTAPDGYTTGDWLMPTWLTRKLIVPLDVQQLGYASLDAFRDDHASAFVAGAIHEGKAYGYPLWFYGVLNHVNTKQFKEVGLDPVKDEPKTWEQLGEVAKRLTVKDGSKFTRQGFKWAMHASQWTAFQFNPILLQAGGQWFDKDGKCTVNNEAGVRAMTIRAAMAKQYGAEDPADSLATAPVPWMDWLKERSRDVQRAAHRPAGHQADQPGHGGGGLLQGLPDAGGQRRQAILDLLRLQLRDQRARVEGQAGRPAPHVPLHHERPARLLESHRAAHVGPQERLDGLSRGQEHSEHPGHPARQGHRRLPAAYAGVDELADAMHRAVQKVTLANGDIKVALNEAAAEVDVPPPS